MFPRRSPSPIHSLLALLIGLGLAPAADAADAASSGARLEASPLEVVASPTLTWSFELKLANDADEGLYADSASCRIEDTDPGQTGMPRVTEFSMRTLAASLGSLSAHESTSVQQSVPGTFESAKVSYRLWGHRGDGTLVSVESPVVALRPGPVSEEHPSEFLEVGGHKVEIVLFGTPGDEKLPGLLFVHDENSHARQQLATAMMLAGRGQMVMLVSMPGYGLSEGTPDEFGDATAEALAAAFDRLAKTPGVDPARLSVWGVSKGAGAVTRLLAMRSNVDRAILQSGRYPEAATLPAPKSKAAILMLHGDADEVSPPAGAKAVAAKLTSGGATVDARFLSGRHALGRGEVNRAVMSFLTASR